MEVDYYMKKILLVEDDDILAFSIEYTLENEGFDVTYAKNLKEAREKISNNEFNLLLLDVRLPDGSGYELWCMPYNHRRSL